MINRNEAITDRMKRGCIINKMDYHSQIDDLVPSECYDYLVNNQARIGSELQRSGLKLIHNQNEGYYYASGNSPETLETLFSLIEVAKAAYLKLGSISALCDHRKGISTQELATISKKPSNAATINKPIDVITNDLEEKGLLYKNNQNKIVLTSSALSMVKKQIKQ